MKVILDTCIIVDFLQRREPFAEDARELLRTAVLGRYQAYTTAKAVADIHYLTHRCTHSEAETRDKLSKLFDIIGILDTTGLDSRRALLSKVSDFEDAMMSMTAERTGMNYIVTRNLRDYKKSQVPALSPGDFLEHLRKQ